MIRYPVLLVVWLMWLWGVLKNDLLRRLAVAISSFVGAAAIAMIASRSTLAIRTPLFVMSAALLLLGLGDAALIYNSSCGGNCVGANSSLQDPLYYLGVLLFLGAGIAIPFAMERAEYLELGSGWKISGIALGVGILFGFITNFVREFTFKDLLFSGVAYFLIAIFVQQTLALAGGRIGKTMRDLSIGFVLAGLAQLVRIIGEGTTWVNVVYDLLWISAMSVILWAATKQTRP